MTASPVPVRSAAAFLAVVSWSAAGAAGEGRRIDFRRAPEQWQTAICLPDDAEKTLVDRDGRVLCRYRGGAVPFSLAISLIVDPAARRTGQALVSPRIPIVRTTRAAPGLKIVEEAFAVTGSPPAPETAQAGRVRITRTDGGRTLVGWARPAAGSNPLLGSVDTRDGGPLAYRVVVAPRAKHTVALAICEGYWDRKGGRMQVLSVEGAPPAAVDTGGDLGKHRPGCFWFDAADTDGDGTIRVRVAPAGTDSDGPVLSAAWVFPAGTARDDDALRAGKLDRGAVAVRYAGSPYEGTATRRRDVILASVKNVSGAPVTVTPKIAVAATVPLWAHLGRQAIAASPHEEIRSSLKMVRAEKRGRLTTVGLESFCLAPGDTARLFAARAVGDPPPPVPATIAAARACRRAAARFWQRPDLRRERIAIPDEQVQALVDAAIRTIRQSREISGGHPLYFPGPTCYRNLWIVDSAFILEVETILGAAADARAGIEHLLGLQADDGRFELIERAHKENGIMLWTCVRHARLTRNRRWLASVWPRLERAADYIRTLRRRSLENDTPLDDGLMPPGFPDGGLDGHTRPEYVNTCWNLLGLKAAIRGAAWLGKGTQAAAWREEYDAFYRAFRKAARRDARADTHGNRFLPVLMGGGEGVPPQKGQWAFCCAAGPGGLFPPGDPLVAGTLAMLKATEKEGIPAGTGWLDGGIWTYFAGPYGHARLQSGDGTGAADCLYAMGNHASPLLAWREEQSLAGEPFRTVGDMPHNWASAAFIRLAVHLLAVDRGDELHLLEGLPVEWARPGMITRLDGIRTPFGPLAMTLAVAADGESARLRVKRLADPSCKRIVVHLDGWAAPKEPGGTRTITLSPAADNDMRIPLGGQ